MDQAAIVTGLQNLHHGPTTSLPHGHADGAWRERPDGARLTLEMSSSATQLDRKRNELWKRYLDAIGIRVEFRIAQWPELLKQSLRAS